MELAFQSCNSETSELSTTHNHIIVFGGCTILSCPRNIVKIQNRRNGRSARSACSTSHQNMLVRCVYSPSLTRKSDKSFVFFTGCACSLATNQRLTNLFLSVLHHNYLSCYSFEPPTEQHSIPSLSTAETFLGFQIL